MGKEYIAFAGYQGTFTDNTSYFQRIRMKNTLLHRDALHLKMICYFDIGTCIENIPINNKYPIYDVYIYHGTIERCELKTYTSLNITACLTDPLTRKRVIQVFSSSSFFNNQLILSTTHK